MSEPETYKVRCADGWTLDVLHIPARGEVRGAAVLGHAMMVDRRSLDRPAGAGFASSLADAGWDVHLPDLRGRGASGPTVDEGGSWTYDEIIAFDLPACVDAVRARRPGDFVWLVGHSLAGHGSIAAAGCGLYSDPPDGHVLLSANMWTPALEPSFLVRRKKAAAVLAFDVIRRACGRFPTRRLGMGPVDECSDYVRDIIRVWRSGRWASRDGTHDYLAGMASVRGPILNVVGKGDRLMAHPSGARTWTDHFGPDRADFWLVGVGDYDLVFDPDHMTVVTDERSRGLWSAITAWMVPGVASDAASV